MRKKIFNKKGQASVEYMLMMGTGVTILLTVMILFHEKLAGIFFWLVGSVLVG